MGMQLRGCDRLCVILFSHFRCARVTCAGSVRVTSSRTLEQILVRRMIITACALLMLVCVPMHLQQVSVRKCMMKNFAISELSFSGDPSRMSFLH